MNVDKNVAEIWLERKIVKLNGKQQQGNCRWKLRYAIVLRADQHRLCIYFSKKKPCREKINPEETLVLHPWLAFSDTAKFKKEKKHHVIRVQLFPNGFESCSSTTWLLSFNKEQDCITWLRIIQAVNTCQLTVEPAMTSIDVRILSTRSSQKFYMDESSRYVILISAQCVILIAKMSQVVIAVWPFSSIRSFSSQHPTSFTINVGRNSPCGEGIYNFTSCGCRGGELLFSALSMKTSYIEEIYQEDETIYMEAISPSNSSTPMTTPQNSPFKTLPRYSDSPPEKPPRIAPVVKPRQKNNDSPDPRASTYSIIFKSPSRRRKRGSSSDPNNDKYPPCCSFSFPTPPPIPRRNFVETPGKTPSSPSFSPFNLSNEFHDLDDFLIKLESLSPTPRKTTNNSEPKPLPRSRRKLSFHGRKKEVDETDIECKQLMNYMLGQIELFSRF